MRPDNLRTKIFLDSGDPQETRRALDLLGFLDGQTTNPSLIAKTIQDDDSGLERTESQLMEYYRSTVSEIASLIPQGSVSIEVYADAQTSSEEIMAQAREMYTWIPNASIKIPLTSAGLHAAEKLSAGGMRLNLTLCFTQAQAAAVYSATRGAVDGSIFVSPFIGRLDDNGERGLDLIESLNTMFLESDHHVSTLAASIRSLEHLVEVISLQTPMVTAPLGVLKEWVEADMPLESNDDQKTTLSPIPARELSLTMPWSDYNIHHDLTDAGLERFAADWNALYTQVDSI